MNPANLTLKTNQASIQIIKDSEDLRLRAYPCPSGVPTIGWGHTKGVCLGMVCAEYEAEEWLKNDILWAEEVVRENVEVPLNENQFSALASFTFNVGGGNFIGSTLLRLLNEEKYEEVPAQLKRWKYGTDRRTKKKVELPGLVIRRDKEAELWSRPV